MTSTLELFLLLFLAPVLFIVSAYLLAKNAKKIPRASSFIAGLFIAAIGVFFLYYTFDLFSQHQAFFPLKNAAPFTKAEHPILFVFCTMLDLAIGLFLLWIGVRAIYRAISKKHTEAVNDAHP